MVDQATFEQELKRLGFGVHHSEDPSAVMNAALSAAYEADRFMTEEDEERWAYEAQKAEEESPVWV